MKKLILILFLFASVNYVSQAQGTVLAAGDLAIPHVETNGADGFGFVTFVDLAAGTVIYFTDCGADATGFKSPTCTEGAQRYTAPGIIKAGTYVQHPTDPGFTSYTDARITGSLNLASAGDQILAFQDSDLGNAVAPGNEPNFIFATNTNETGFTGDKNDSNETGLPTGLSTAAPVTALGLGSGPNPNDEFDNVVYNGVAGYVFNTIADMKAAFTNPANFLGENGNPPSATYNNFKAALAGTALPIELLNFSGQIINEAIELRWSTASEKENKYFILEKRTGLNRFRSIGSVEGAGTSFITQEYTWTDDKPYKGLAYYRLKQVDFNGAFEYSNVIAIRYGATTSEVNMFPNPAVDKLNLQITDAEALENSSAAKVQIYTTTSQLVKELSLGNGFNGTVSFTIEDIPSGVYFVRLTIGEQEYFEKLVIRK